MYLLEPYSESLATLLMVQNVRAFAGRLNGEGIVTWTFKIINHAFDVWGKLFAVFPRP